MGIVRITTDKQISDEVLRQSAMIGGGIVNILNFVGQTFVRQARESLNIDTGAFPAVHKMTKREIAKGKKQPKRGDYMDQTANLRSSIGYFVLQNGVVVHENIQGTAEGITAAQTMLSRVPAKSGYQLIGVAGMDYASYLESQGYNVITSQAALAMVNLETRLKAFAGKRGLTDPINAEVFIASALR